MSKRLRVLIVEDSEDDVALLLLTLRKSGYDPVWARVDTAGAMEAALRDCEWDVVLSDYTMPAFNARSALALVQKRDADLPFIIVSGSIGEETAVEAMKAGAHDFFVKGQLARLAASIERELRDVDVRRERRRAIEALREVEERRRGSEERYRELVENISEMLFSLDSQGIITYVSPACRRILGYEPEELHGRHFLQYIHAEDRTVASSAVGRVLTGASEEVEMRLVGKDGRPHWVTGSGRPITDGPRVIGLRGVVTDITARRAVEEQLEQAQKLEALGRLAAGVAHDFNNLLQAMFGAASMLQSSAGDSRQLAELQEELLSHIRRGSSLTRQLLLFSRREVSQRAALDLNDVVAGFGKMIKRLVREDIRVEIMPAAEPLPIMGDAAQLEQVLMNLVVNSADAMPDGGDLRVRTGPESDDCAWVEVEDSGVGMSPDVRAQIFEPFFTTKGVGKGTGLGLSVVHGIVTQHGGTIDVDSTPGRGTRFRIRVPRADSPSRPASAAAGARAESTTLLHGYGERILVVEDDPPSREGLCDMLVALSYEAVAVGSAEEALALDPDRPFRLMLTDLVLPGLSGIDLADHLRRRWPRLKVVLMTGYTDDDRVQRWVRERSDAFLQKPFEMTLLAREVRRMIDQP